MPVYEYECVSCGERFELRRGLLDKKGKEKCPKCASTDLRRVYSPFGCGSAGCASESTAPRRFG